MAEIWEDAVEKVGKPLQEIGITDTHSPLVAEKSGNVNKLTYNPLERGGEYIDIHTTPEEKTGIQTQDNCSDCDEIKLSDEKTSGDSISASSAHSGTSDEHSSDSKTQEHQSDNYDEDLCIHENEETDQCDAEGDDDDDDYHSADEGEEEIVVDEELLKEVEDKLTDEEKEERHQQAQAEKVKGNNLFKESSFKEAIKCYCRALQCCPLMFPKDRSIMYSNRAACKLRMECYEDAIADSTSALDLNPYYLKALMRRAELYEKTDKLDECLCDYQKILEMDPSQYAARAACVRLPEQIKERNEKLKTEMIDKLKDLGNMVLKPFGLSTENFQLKQDPTSGSYSVNFNQNEK